MKFEFEYECDKSWDDMKGGDRRRHCDSCDKKVHHISGMTAEEARAFLEEHDYEVCVDFFRDEDGHTVFREAAKKLRLQNDGIKQLLASAAALIPLALAGAFIDTNTSPQPVASLTAPATPPPVVEPSAPSPAAAAATTPTDTDDDPIGLDGPTPVVHADPVIVPEPHVDPPPPATDEIEVEPFVAEVEPDPQPAVEERPRRRGRVRPPKTWRYKKKETSEYKPLPVDPFYLD